jgi:hypothetical protein
VFDGPDGLRGRTVITDYEAGLDQIVLTGAAFVARIQAVAGQVVVTLAGDGDRSYLRGDGLTADDLVFVTESADFVL